MTTASDRPPTSKRSDTKSPYAVLSPEVSRNQTGTRVKISERTDDSADPFSNPKRLDPSIPPESLKKPFASLTPQTLPTSSDEMSKVGAPPPPPSQLFRETASMRAPTQTKTPTYSRRPESGAVARYGTCKVHGTALTSSASCVLCTREEERRRVGRMQRLIFVLSGIALLVGLAVAAYVMPR